MDLAQCLQLQWEHAMLMLVEDQRAPFAGAIA